MKRNKLQGSGKISNSHPCENVLAPHIALQIQMCPKKYITCIGIFVWRTPPFLRHMDLQPFSFVQTTQCILRGWMLLCCLCARFLRVTSISRNVVCKLLAFASIYFPFCRLYFTDSPSPYFVGKTLLAVKVWLLFLPINSHRTPQRNPKGEGHEMKAAHGFARARTDFNPQNPQKGGRP